MSENQEILKLNWVSYVKFCTFTEDFLHLLGIADMWPEITLDTAETKNITSKNYRDWLWNLRLIFSKWYRSIHENCPSSP